MASSSHRKRKQGEISRDCVRKTLVKSTQLLCDNLRIDAMLLALLSKEAVKSDDVTKIKKKDTDTEKVEALLGVLAKAPVSSYQIFMTELKKDRRDLYEDVKRIKEEVMEEVSLEESGATSSKKARSKKARSKKAVLSASRKAQKTTDGTEQITEDDCYLIAKELGMAQLKNLYGKLGLKKSRVEKEEKTTSIDDADLKARNVLLYWRQSNGREATRMKVLLGLKECDDSHNEIESLQGKWKIQNDLLN